MICTLLRSIVEVWENSADKSIFYDDKKLTSLGLNPGLAPVIESGWELHFWSFNGKRYLAARLECAHPTYDDMHRLAPIVERAMFEGFPMASGQRNHWMVWSRDA